jgi:diguanylate cyclase (GGDEF)-like protein/PAS domain S-box-containing protein
VHRVYLASLRLAVGLVCIGISTILGGQWLGLIPDPDRMTLRARADRCELVSVAAGVMLQRMEWTPLESSLQTVAQRDSELLSIGLRRADGTLRIDTGHHDYYWQEAGSFPDRFHTLHVPLTVNGESWGQLEFLFEPVSGSGWSAVLHHPLMRLIAFFSLVGLIVYTAIVARVVGSMDGGQVVPDRVRQALDTLAEGLLVLDERERIVLANKSFADTIHRRQEDLLGRMASNLGWLSSRVAQKEDYPWNRSIIDCKPITDQHLRYQLPDGTQRVFSINAAPIITTGNRHRGVLVTFRDVTHIEEHRAQLESMLAMLQSSRDEISRKNRELEVLATQDALTGCLNRRAFFERLEQAWVQARTRQQPLACLMVDVDHFKNVNDTYGHQTGDQVLRKISETLRKLVGSGQFVARYGGEEFCILLPGSTIEETQRFSDRLLDAVRAIRLSNPADVRLSVSVGASERGLGAEDPQALINQADMALYAAKRTGRDRQVTYREELANMKGVDAGRPAEPKPAQGVPFQAVSSLVAALSFRDHYTANHSRRVADLCVLVGEGLLSHHQTYMLEMAALLHDIGKIGIPDHVLHKPGPLTDEEWRLMGRHEQIGVEIVESAFNCQSLTEIIRLHGAYFNGTGRVGGGIVGESLPIGARLLAIADSYDAMVSDRIYRAGRPPELAFAELRRCAGSQFDPDLVEHFIACVKHRARQPQPGERVSTSKQVAVQIGVEIERLVSALDAHDIRGIGVLAERLQRTAKDASLEEIESAAEQLRGMANASDPQLIHVMEQTLGLLRMCRQTQSVLVQAG